MATLSSMLKIVDGFTSPIQKNIDIMTKMIDIMERMNRAGDMPGLENAFEDIRQNIDAANQELEEFGNKLDDVRNKPDTVNNGIKSWETSLLSANAALDLFHKGINLVKSGAGQVGKLLGEADTSNLAKQQLAVVMANQGSSYNDFQSVLNKSAEMQGRSTYGSELFAGAAAELSTYLKSSEAINKLLDTTMADYAAGMGGISLTYQQMVDYATQLGKALDGTYDGLQKKGFVLTDAQKKIIDTGTEMERVAVLAEVIGSSWDGLAESMANTPQGVLQSMNNELSAIRANMGQELYPEILNMSQLIIDNLPLIQSLAATTVEALQRVMGFIANPLLPGILSVGQAIQDTYYFFNDNWTNIEPVLWGIGFAVGALTTALLIYKGVAFAIATVEAIKGAAQMISTGATIAATAAQWGLNAALLANPVTWVVIAIVALIAIIVALSVWLYRLWQTNIDFRVGVITVWNNLLGFFDQVPIFFQWVGNGVLDALSYMKVGAAMILQGMVNDAIENINRLIELVNKISGVSISTIGAVDFGTRTALEEEAKRQARADDLQSSRDTAALRAAERENKLAQDSARWREEAAAKEAELQTQNEENAKRQDPYESMFSGNGFDGSVEVGGGSLDKVGKIGTEVDISNQSLMYLRDIAEIYALESINTYSTIAYEGINEARLSSADADLLKSAAGHNTNVYYLNYSGGVRINADVKKGEDWATIRREMEAEIDNDIESGLSDIDRVVNG